MSLLDDIQRARDGKIITIPFYHDKLKKYIFLTKGVYHLVGGASGSGKSAWIDYNYVLYPTYWYKNVETDIKLKIILRSMERSKKLRIAKWVCMKLYRKHGILIDTNSLLGWGVEETKITDELFALVKQCYALVEEELDGVVEVIDGIDNPTGIYYQLADEALSKGTLYKYRKHGEDYVITKQRGNHKSQPIRVQPEECPECSKFQPVYVPDNPKEVTIFIVDHLQAMKSEKGYSDKQNLDQMSEYTRILRDLYGFTPVIVNQLNRNISDTFRKVKTDLLPQDSDFTGSSNMVNDCDMAGILFNPYKYGLNKLPGSNWNVKECIDNYGINRFRSFHLLKNTYGPDSQHFGYQFIGENGIFNELPNTISDYTPIAYPKNKQKITNYV